MIEGKSIVCFSNDWENDPTSKHHIMRILSRHNKVLWINSIGMRRPNMTGSDISRIITKVKGWFKGACRVNENLYYFSPIVLPFPSSKVIARVNSLFLKLSISYYCKKLGMGPVQLWTFLPNIVEIIGRLDEELLVYYCVDEWSKFSFVDGEALRAQEIELITRSDLVITTADHLYRDKVVHNNNTHLITHGVDYNFFSQALDDATPRAEELADMEGPIIGFFGLIHEWIDLSLIEHIASTRPNFNLVLIGKCAVDVEFLEKLDNITFLGQRPYAQLISFCKSFSIGLIPFKVNELTINVNPIKMREYLAAGLPVVSTSLPEIEKYKHLVAIGKTEEEIVTLIDKTIFEDNVTERLHRSKQMIKETWERKVEDISILIDTSETFKQ